MNNWKLHRLIRFSNFRILLIFFIISSCIEPFEGSFENFEDTLVVNAVLTNENTKQEIQLARSYKFDEDGPSAEQNAYVTITDADGFVREFEEVSPGVYNSFNEFAAVIDNSYYLTIRTEDGKLYRSDSMQLPKANTQIDQLYAERLTNEKGVDGLGIFIDTFDPTKSSNFYRYEFIETYKIIAPFWTPFDRVLLFETAPRTPDDQFAGPEFGTVLREQEERLCYGTGTSKTIDVINTSNLSEDRLSRHEIRFISNDDYILTYRYSILVRQYIQSPKAFEYFEILKGLSQSSTDLFSEDQPGFLTGNIFAIEDKNENVAGFFEVVTVDEKRIFFNYEDYFPGEALPPYFIECEPYSAGNRLEEAKIVKDKSGVFYDDVPGAGVRMVQRPCGDCTVLGSNKKPKFWID